MPQRTCIFCLTVETLLKTSATTAKVKIKEIYQGSFSDCRVPHGSHAP